MNFIRRFLLVFASGVAPFAVTLVTLPILIHTIGMERYGLLAICWMVTGYVTFLQFGMGRAVVQRLNAGLRIGGEGITQRRVAIISSALMASLVTSAVAAIMGMVGYQVYSMTLQPGSPSLHGEIFATLPWLGFAVLFTLITNTVLGILQADERFATYSAFKLTGIVGIQLAPLAAALLVGPHLDNLVAAAALARAANLAAITLAVRADVAKVRLRWITRDSLLDLLSFGGWVSFIGLIAPLLVILDRFLIGSIMGAGAVGIYTVAYNLCTRLFVMPASIGAVLLPRLARETEARSIDLSARGLDVVAAIMTPVLVAFVFLYEPFVSIWLNPSVAAESEATAAFLAVGVWSASVAQVPYTRLIGEGRLRVIAMWYLGQIPFYAALLWTALSAYGLAGAAFAWSVRATIDAVGLLKMANVRITALHAVSLLIILMAPVAALLAHDPVLKWSAGAALLSAAVAVMGVIAIGLGVVPLAMGALRVFLGREQAP